MEENVGRTLFCVCLDIVEYADPEDVGRFSSPTMSGMGDAGVSVAVRSLPTNSFTKSGESTEVTGFDGERTKAGVSAIS